MMISSQASHRKHIKNVKKRIHSLMLIILERQVLKTLKINIVVCKQCQRKQKLDPEKLRNNKLANKIMKIKRILQ